MNKRMKKLALMKTTIIWVLALILMCIVMFTKPDIADSLTKVLVLTCGILILITVTFESLAKIMIEKELTKLDKHAHDLYDSCAFLITYINELNKIFLDNKMKPCYVEPYEQRNIELLLRYRELRNWVNEKRNKCNSIQVIDMLVVISSFLAYDYCQFSVDVDNTFNAEVERSGELISRMTNSKERE